MRIEVFLLFFLFFRAVIFAQDESVEQEIFAVVSQLYSYLGSDIEYSERPDIFIGGELNPYEGKGLLNNVLGEPFSDPLETAWWFLDHFESALSNREPFPVGSPVFVSKISFFGDVANEPVDDRFYVILRAPYRVSGAVKDVFKAIQFRISVPDEGSPKIDVLGIEVNGVELLHYAMNATDFSAMNFLQELGFPRELPDAYVERAHP